MKRILLILFAVAYFHTCYGQVAETVPFVNGGVKTILRYNNNLFILGDFSQVGSDSTLNGLAMLDAHTSALQTWNPAPVGAVQAMIIQNGKLIVAGDFTNIAGQARTGLAIFDAATGTLDPMTINGFSDVLALWADSNTIYFVGSTGFYWYVQSFDLNTGILSSWQSASFNAADVYTVAKCGNYVYVGGVDMEPVGLGSNNYEIMRFDAVSGAIDSAFMAYSFVSGDQINQILPYNNHIYVCGQFSDFNGGAAHGFLALDSIGNLTTFNIGCDGDINFIMYPQGHYLWVGGNSDVFGGQTPYYAAQIDLNTGFATCWVNPDIDLGMVWSILPEGDTVYLGAWSNFVGNAPFGGGLAMAVGGVITGPITATVSYNNFVCNGSNDTFIPTPSNLSANLVYEWYGQYGSIGYEPTFVDSNLVNSDSIYLMVTNMCDFSTYTSPWIHFSVLPLSGSSLTAAICQGGTYTFGSHTLTQSGTYYDTLTGHNGCDSTVTLTLSLYTLNTHVNQTICQGASYPFAGQNLSQAGIYYDTLVGQGGCDSIVKLTLSVGYVPTHIRDSICPGAAYNFHGQILTQAGIYYDTLASSIGCDSAIILTLIVDSVNPNVSFTQSGNSCLGSDTLRLSGLAFVSQIQWLLNGAVAGVGTAFDSLYIPASPGSYNIVVTQGNCYDTSNTFIVNPVLDTTIYQSICQGDSFRWNGQAFTQSGTYVDTFSALTACDSIVTLTLIVNPLPVISISETGELCSAGRDTLAISGHYSYPINWESSGSVIAIDSQIATTVAGYVFYGTSFGGSGANALQYPTGLYVDSGGNIYIADNGNNRVQKWAPGATTGTTVAGGNGYGTNANQLKDPSDVFLDTSGNVYVTDYNNNRVQKWASGATTGITVAGNVTGYGTAANLLNGPSGLFIDRAGDLYISDFANNRIQKWASGATSGITVAGDSNGQPGNSASRLREAQDAYLDGAGNLFIADWLNSRIQKWAPGADSGVTVVGSASGLFLPSSVFVDNSNNIYVSDWQNNWVKKFAPGDSIGVIVAGGNGSGDGPFSFNYPSAVWVDNASNIYVTDQYNNRVQKYTQSTTYIPTTPGSYTASVTDAHGCVAISNAIIVQNNSIQLNDTVCHGTSISVGSQVYSSTGIYIDTFISSQGCDSIVTLNLRVMPLLLKSIDTAFCAGYSIHIGTNDYSTSGTYIDTLTSVTGCDSIVTLNLLVNPISSVHLYDTICSNTSITIGGHIYSHTGSYSDTLNSIHGCDSIVTLNLLVNPISSANLYDTICSNSSFNFGGHSYSHMGIYPDTLTTGLGCDSIVSLNLLVYPSVSVIQYDTLSIGDTLHIGAQRFYTSGVYYDTLNTMHGCDSAITIYLLVDTPATFAHLFDTICQGLSVSVSGHTYTVSGTYIDTITGTLGGDSIITLNLTVTNAVINNVYDTISQGSYVSFGTQTYSQPGIYIDTTINAAGCDDLTALHLFVVTGINELSFISGVTIYPNPTQGSFTMEIDAPSISTKSAEISVINMMGQEVMGVPVTLQAGNNKELIPLSEGTSAGVYVVQLTVDGQSLYYRLVLDK